MNMMSREGFPYGPALTEGIKPVIDSEGHMETLVLDHNVTYWLWSALGNVQNIAENNVHPEEVYEGVTALWPRQAGELRDRLLDAKRGDGGDDIFQSEMPVDLLEQATTYLQGTVATAKNRRTTRNHITSRFNYFGSNTSQRDEVIKNTFARHALAIDAADIIQHHLRQESAEE